MFKHLDSMTKFGKYGNADINLKKDWTDITDDAMTDFGKATWDEGTKSCNVYASVLIKVVIDTMGFDENPQYYVKKITKTPILENWKYPSFYTDSTLEAREVDFNHFVTVQYVNVAASKENANGLIDSADFRLSMDMFYPAFLRQNSQAATVSGVVGSLALLYSTLSLSM